MFRAVEPSRRAILLTLCAAPASSQERVEDGRPDIRIEVDLVNIVCTVRNWVGAYVNDLARDEFRIFEDRKPQEIRYFSREARTPVTVALLIDVSGSVSRVLDKERVAVSRFLVEVLRPSDRALLASFSHTVQIGQDLTSDQDRLFAAVKSIHPFDLNLAPEFGAHGGTLLYEAIKLVCDGNLRGLAGRKAVVVVSDGLDNGSRVTAAAAIEAAQQADAVIYGIHYNGDASDRPEGEAALYRMAGATGGRSFNVNLIVTLDSIFGSIRKDMQSQYAIGYVSTNRSRDGSYRRIAVEITRRRHTIQVRQGYYAPRG